MLETPSLIGLVGGQIGIEILVFHTNIWETPDLIFFFFKQKWEMPDLANYV